MVTDGNAQPGRELDERFTVLARTFSARVDGG
jgi:hypothetical protein